MVLQDEDLSKGACDAYSKIRCRYLMNLEIAFAAFSMSTTWQATPGAWHCVLWHELVWMQAGYARVGHLHDCSQAPTAHAGAQCYSEAYCIVYSCLVNNEAIQSPSHL
jgi:hypothetical protein